MTMGRTSTIPKGLDVSQRSNGSQHSRRVDSAGQAQCVVEIRSKIGVEAGHVYHLWCLCVLCEEEGSEGEANGSENEAEGSRR